MAAAKQGSALPARLKAAKYEQFELFLTDGSFRLRLTLTDKGVSPGARAIDYMLGGEWRSRPYSEIVSIDISTSAIGDSAIIGICTLQFRYGDQIVVTSANANGLSDGSRDEAYDAFIVELHRRIVASGASEKIAFRSGFSQSRSRTLVVALWAAAVLLVVLPVGLFFATGNWGLLLGAWAVGVTLIYPATRLVGQNRPATYPPAEPPDLLS